MEKCFSSCRIKKYTYNIEAGGDKKRHPKAIIEKEMNLYRRIDA